MKKVSSSRSLPIVRWLLVFLPISVPAYGQAVSGVMPWGDNSFGQLSVPPGLTNVVGVASGSGHNLALSANGTVVAWGNNASGQTNVPPSLSNVRAVTAGSANSLVLKSNGTLVAWGTPSFGLNSVPAGISNIVAIGSGPAASHNLVIKSNRTVTGWGNNDSGQLTFPAGLSDVVAVGGGIFHSLALKADGTLVAWGNNSFQQTSIPAGLSNVIAIAVGVYHNVALRANGTVVVWGDNSHGQLNVPSGLSNVVAIACGYYHSLAARADGTLIGWGYNSSGQAQPPAGLTNVVAISGGNAHSLALAGSAPLIFGQPHDVTVVESSSATFSVGAAGFPAISYQWRFNGTNVAGATGSSLTMSPVHLNDAGSYSVLVASSLGCATSTPALLAVTPLLVAQCADVTVSADVNCVANASIDAGSTNPSGGTITLTQSPPGPYPLGTNLVTLIVTDNNGGSASCSARVIVVDRTPPQIAPPANIVTPNDPNQCGAIVTFAQPVASDSCSAVTHVPPPPPSTSLFPVGTTIVQCTATDAAGNTANTNFSVTVLDLTPPQLTRPANIRRTNDLNQCGAIVTFAQPVASDNCSGVIQITCAPPSGSFFPVGATIVQCTATDAAGNTAVTNFTVTVLDRTPPQIIRPANIRRTNDLNQCGAIVTFPLPVANDSCSAVTNITCTPPSGSFFPVGRTVVQCTATDAAGNSASTNFTVIVCNRQPPQITPPANIIRSNDLNQCGAIVTFALPTATDSCPGAISITCTPASGSLFPVGTTVVQCTATDVAGNAAAASFTVTVLDRTPPQIIRPANLRRTNDLNQCGAVVTFALPTATDGCSGVASVTCTPPSGSFFPVGKTVVQCVANDAAGNTAVTNFTVTVCDRQAPTIVCPADIVVTNTHHDATSVVTYSPVASDNCSALQVVCNPPSGSAFEVGVHTVQCWATDASGNFATCSFHVTVWPGNKAPVPIIQLAPLVTLPYCTNLTVIAPDSTNADVICDGSKSYDPDGDTFRAAWFVGNTCVSTDLVASVTLPLGIHTITLVLDDNFPNGRSAKSVQVEVISPEEAIGRISDLVENSGLPAQRQHPLLVSLNAAAVSAASDNLHAELGQLGAFQHKVHAQLKHTYPDLATELIDAAQELIDALSPVPSRPRH